MYLHQGMMLKKYQQLQATIQWSSFEHNKTQYRLSHLNVHEVTYIGSKESYTFVVTYGLHCFAKDDEPTTIDVEYTDSSETRKVSMERYNASFALRGIIEKFPELKFGEVGQEKFFCFDALNSESGIAEPYKVCFVLFKEERFLRMHITS